MKLIPLQLETETSEPIKQRKPDFANLAEILGGNLEPEKPTICSFKDGNGALLYSGRLNEAHGEPGIGKTNFALAATVKVINSGGIVIYIDPEDNPTAFVRKLLCFGADPQAIIERVKYTNDATPANLEAVLNYAIQNPATLCNVDGLAECLSAAGLSENAAEDFLKFVSCFLRPIAKTGAAVLINDHVVKNGEGGRYSRGTGAKLGCIDGVSYQIKPGKSYSPTREGFIKLAIAKDRNGGVGAVGQPIAEIWFSPTGDGKTQVSINQIESSGGDFKPTALMGKVVEHLKSNPEATKRDLRKLGNSNYIDKAIECLVDDGSLQIESEGAGRRQKFVVIDAETEADL